MEKMLALLKSLGAKDADIDAAREEAEANQALATERLQKKNQELIGELRRAKGSGNEDVQRLQDENETLKGQLETSNKAVRKLETDLGKVRLDLEGQLNGERQANHRLLIEDGLTKGLIELGVTNPTMQAAARALLKEKGILQVKSEGDARRAIAILKKDGKDQELDLKDFLSKEWAGSDEGKSFIPAANNSGSGAGGRQGTSGDNGKTMPQADYDAMRPAERAKFINAGGKPI